MSRKKSTAGKPSRKSPGTRAAPASPPTGFPVVGIGASAGGLETIEEFFAHLPPDTGKAFVVVTHQHPGHTSLPPELLGKDTGMPLVAAEDGLRLEPEAGLPGKILLAMEDATNP